MIEPYVQEETAVNSWYIPTIGLIQLPDTLELNVSFDFWAQIMD